MTRILLVLGITVISLAVVWLERNNDEAEIFVRLGTPLPSASGSPIMPLAAVFPITSPVNSIQLTSIIRSDKVLLEVPFTAQAPIGNWDDSIYQNACEEASVLMAMRWVNGKPLTTQEAMTEIKDMSEYTLKQFGHYHDVSAADTVRLISDYYGYSGVRLVSDIGARDINQELQKGNLVIVPINGQLLPNPFYTPPGPLEHMLVVRGYDPETNEFITNDPGTKRGRGIRYKTTVLEAALQDYSTGYHEPIDRVNKVMIVVEPEVNQ